MARLVHHVNNGSQPYAEAWTTTDRLDAPSIPAVCETALRRRVMDLRHKGDETTKWYHCEGWAAVMDLHQKGKHDDALALAKFLYWCDRQANGRVTGFWELVG